MTHPGVAEIAIRFKKYNSDINEIYEDYLFVSHYLPILHGRIKSGEIADMEYESAHTDYKAAFKRDRIYGVIDRLIKKSNPENTLINSVTLTEYFLQSVISRVYRDYPHKLESKDEPIEQKGKLLKLILNCRDINEIICKIIEEKVRGIFYGSPVDVFEKDKAKLGFGCYFKDNYNKALSEYAEIIARRNVYIHNHGRIDSKYLREAPNSRYTIGERPTIDKEYIRKTIKILRAISAITTKLVIEKTYGATKLKTKLQSYIDTFDLEYKSK